MEQLQEEKLQIFENMNELLDVKLENEHFIREMMIRLKGETDKCKTLEKDKVELTEFCLSLKSQIQE
jgi:hypothetical protein